MVKMFTTNSIEDIFEQEYVKLEQKDLRPNYVPKQRLSDEESKKVIEKMIQDMDITHKPTNEVYKTYKILCEKFHIGYMSLIGFSRFMVSNHGFVVKDKHLGGVKYRMFVKGSK